MKKKENGYSYNPSYLFKKGSKYSKLVLDYNDIFIKISNGGIKSLNDKEKEKFFFSIDQIKYYVYGSFFYSVREKYETKQNSEKIITAIYWRYVSFLGSEQAVKDEISASILDLAERSIYYSIGVESYKKRNFKWDSEDSYYGNFLKHIIKIPFSELIYIYMKEINMYLDMEVQKNSLEEDLLVTNSELSDREEAYDLIKNSGIEKYIPQIIYHKIIDYLSGEIEYKDLTEEDVKYLNKIYKSGL